METDLAALGAILHRILLDEDFNYWHIGGHTDTDADLCLDGYISLTPDELALIENYTEEH